MRHRVSGYKLGRDQGGRRALLVNLASSLITEGSITTTEAKAKFAKPYVEKLITLAKKNRLEANRKIASTITNNAFRRLIDEIAPGYGSRVGGYTRIIKHGVRRGDNAKLAKLELIEWEKVAKVKKTKKPITKSEKTKLKLAKNSAKKKTAAQKSKSAVKKVIKKTK